MPPVGAFGAGASLPFVGQRQAGKQWCWLAVASMISRHESPSHWMTQCELAARCIKDVPPGGCCTPSGGVLGGFDVQGNVATACTAAGHPYERMSFDDSAGDLVSRMVDSLENDDMVALRADARIDGKPGGHVVLVPEAYMSGHFTFWDPLMGGNFSLHVSDPPSMALGFLVRWTTAFFPKP